MWDTAGQDRFKCVVSSFYRGAHGVLICFDITDLESFRNVDNWLEEVKRYCANETPVFLVGTKSDLQSKRMVPYPIIKAYVDRKSLSYVETSSKTNENIENCFMNFTRALVEHNDQLNIIPKSKEEKVPDDLTNGRKPIKDVGCVGGDKCII